MSHVQHEGNEVIDALSKWVVFFNDEDEIRLEDFYNLPVDFDETWHVEVGVHLC